MGLGTGIGLEQMVYKAIFAPNLVPVDSNLKVSYSYSHYYGEQLLNMVALVVLKSETLPCP